MHIQSFGRRAPPATLAFVAALACSLSPAGCSCDPEPDPPPPTPPVPTATLVVPDGAAGCEILLTETNRAADGAISVAFGEGTRGTSIREAPKVAVAATGDLDITVTGAFAIASSRCVDAAGADVGEVSAP